MQQHRSSANAVLQQEEIEVISSIYSDCLDIVSDTYGERALLFRHVPKVVSDSEHFELVVSDCECVNVSEKSNNDDNSSTNANTSASVSTSNDASASNTLTSNNTLQHGNDNKLENEHDNDNGDDNSNSEINLRNLSLMNPQLPLSVKVRNLPPITLLVRLPAGYPVEERAQLDLSCVWLSRRTIANVLEHLNRLSVEAGQNGDGDGDGNGSDGGVLFTILDFIVNELVDWAGMKTDRQFDLSGEFKTSESRSDAASASASASASTSAGVQEAACCSGDSSHKATRGTNMYVRSLSWMCERTRCGALHRLLAQVSEFDKSARRASFKTSRLECPVCFAEVLGSEAVQLETCEHAFCSSCFSAYVAERIRSNAVKIECGQRGCEEAVPEWQIREAVDNELFGQYEKRSFEVGLQTMEDSRVFYCPRTNCGRPVLLDRKKDNQFDSVAVCSACFFAFCTKCERANHGILTCEQEEEVRLRAAKKPDEVDAYEIARIFKFVVLYRSTPEEKRRKLVKFYFGTGENMREQLERVALASNLEVALHKFCPNCRVPIFKESGCNKMHCVNCNISFCFSCLQIISSYAHFESSKCSLWIGDENQSLNELLNVDYSLFD